MFRVSRQEKIDAISAFLGVLVGEFCIMPFSLGFSNVILISRLGLWVLVGEDHREKVPFSSHDIKDICYQDEPSLLMFTVGDGLSASTTVELFVFALLCILLFGRKSLCTGHT